MNGLNSATRFIIAATAVAGSSKCEQCKISDDIFSNTDMVAFESGNISTKKVDTTEETPIPVNPQQYEKWTSKLERRFEKLFVKEYLGSASKDELVELRELTEARELFKSPMSADEIIAEMKREKAAQDLIIALKNYKKYVG
ncbi:MAG: hypothetical protein J6P03_08450 [Opitutales bacterium]|nr:hypothetical protein [Opitutales bacterium]